MNPVQAVGRSTLGFLRQAGAVVIFAGRGVAGLLGAPFFFSQFLRQLMAIGYLSLPVVGLTAVFPREMIIRSRRSFAALHLSEYCQDCVCIWSK